MNVVTFFSEAQGFKGKTVVSLKGRKRPLTLLLEGLRTLFVDLKKKKKEAEMKFAITQTFLQVYSCLQTKSRFQTQRKCVFVKRS